MPKGFASNSTKAHLLDEEICARWCEILLTHAFLVSLCVGDFRAVCPNFGPTTRCRRIADEGRLGFARRGNRTPIALMHLKTVDGFSLQAR
jgi:hypothetical protein